MLFLLFYFSRKKKQNTNSPQTVSLFWMVIISDGRWCNRGEYFHWLVRALAKRSHQAFPAAQFTLGQSYLPSQPDNFVGIWPSSHWMRKQIYVQISLQILWCCLRPVHTGRRAPCRRHHASNGTHCCKWECSHGLTATSKGLHANLFILHICLRVLCELPYTDVWNTPIQGNLLYATFASTLSVLCERGLMSRIQMS